MPERVCGIVLFKSVRKHFSVEELSRKVGESAQRIEALFDKIQTLLEESEAAESAHVIIDIDGAARGNPGPAGAGVVIADSQGALLAELREFLGEVTNNVAEYQALRLGLQRACELNARSVSVRSDSELLVKQIQGAYRVKNSNLISLFEDCKWLVSRFDSFSIQHIPREANKHADVLANNAIDAALAKRGRRGGTHRG